MISNRLFFLLVFFAYINSCQPNNINTQFIDLIKKMATGNSLSNWDSINANNGYCNYTGIACDNQQNIIQIDISGWSLSGEFPQGVCSYLPQLRVLRLGLNTFDSDLPRGITNCSSLEELNVSSVHFTGPLPDFSSLKSLRVLDLSYNLFSGDFSLSILNLTNLELLNVNENDEFNMWELPENISQLSKIKTLILASCSLRGEIPPAIGNMTSLVDLELTGNDLVGRIPSELGRLKNLRHLELYYNQLDSEIPREIGNLTKLRDLDMSVNKLSGRIPAAICSLPGLVVLQLYSNNLVGEIPGVIANSTTLNTLSLYENFLTGEIPRNLGTSSIMEALDLSENRLSGRLPEGLCSGGKLNYLLVLENQLSGVIPIGYEECKSLDRFRVSSNNLEGEIPPGILSLPHASIIDVAYNNFTGSISRTIQNARNLSQLFMQANRFSGFIPPQIGNAISLVKIDLSNNLLSGPIPSQIGNLERLNLLMLQGNRLTSCIPDSFSSLKFLNLLDLSSNCLTGKIPESLSKLLPNSLNFSNNHLSGEIPFAFVKGGVLDSFSGNPSLCLPANVESPVQNFAICSQNYNRKKLNSVWVIGILVGVLTLGIVLFLKRWLKRDKEVIEHEDNNTLSSSFFSYDVKSFHRLSFDEREIIEAMVDKNIVGYGGSGTVYKIELNNGENVAVKRLWSQRSKDSASENQVSLDRELKTEVETLGSIRHKNIVKLFCYFSSLDCSLLVYEYMSNGNLWDALHREKVLLDWPTRHQIALGIAQGLAYLHHDLIHPIIHRDIKSTNILLDMDYQPKVADFGIAKVLQARGSKDSTTTTTVTAGTYGYLAPEYAYSSKATTKCDVYSFGVVLMELVTGKKPVEEEFGENKNIVSWVCAEVESKEGDADVVDKRVWGPYKADMMKVLGIAIRCTCKAPTLRPPMNQVVQHLIEADPCKIHCCNFTAKISI